MNWAQKPSNLEMFFYIFRLWNSQHLLDSIFLALSYLPLITSTIIAEHHGKWNEYNSY